MLFDSFILRTCGQLSCCHFELVEKSFPVMPSECGVSILRRSGSLLLLLQCRLESAETERHRGLDEQLILLAPLRGSNVFGQCSSCRFASPPPAQAAAHFRFRTRACTAAATGFLRPFGQRQRGLPPVVVVGWLRKARENVSSLPYTEEGGHPFSRHSTVCPFPSFHGLSVPVIPRLVRGICFVISSEVEKSQLYLRI